MFLKQLLDLMANAPETVDTVYAAIELVLAWGGIAGTVESVSQAHRARFTRGQVEIIDQRPWKNVLVFKTCDLQPLVCSLLHFD